SHALTMLAQIRSQGLLTENEFSSLSPETRCHSNAARCRMNLHMVAWSRFSTSTVIDSEYFVPWLSAEGPLAYSPTKPPARDYFFQYTWILPGIFNPQVHLREHR